MPEWPSQPFCHKSLIESSMPTLFTIVSYLNRLFYGFDIAVVMAGRFLGFQMLILVLVCHGPGLLHSLIGGGNKDCIDHMLLG